MTGVATPLDQAKIRRLAIRGAIYAPPPLRRHSALANVAFVMVGSAAVLAMIVGALVVAGVD